MDAKRKIVELVNWPGYLVGDDGTLWTRTPAGGAKPGGRRLARHLLPVEDARQLTGTVDADGYIQVSLVKDGKTYFRKLHCLVLEAFVGPRPAGHVACHHPDPTRTNNVVTNLRWDTQSANNLDRMKVALHGRSVSIDEKLCRTCDTVQPKSSFYMSRASHDQLTHMCKACTRAYGKKRQRPARR